MNKKYNRDCFAFKETNSNCTCKALNEIVCKKNENCPFYKSVEQENKELGEMGTIENAIFVYESKKRNAG